MLGNPQSINDIPGPVMSPGQKNLVMTRLGSGVSLSGNRVTETGSWRHRIF